jgi:hypothetical protein
MDGWMDGWVGGGWMESLVYSNAPSVACLLWSGPVENSQSSLDIWTEYFPNARQNDTKIQVSYVLRSSFGLENVGLIPFDIKSC